MTTALDIEMEIVRMERALRASDPRPVRDGGRPRRGRVTPAVPSVAGAERLPLRGGLSSGVDSPPRAPLDEFQWRRAEMLLNWSRAL